MLKAFICQKKVTSLILSSRFKMFCLFFDYFHSLCRQQLPFKVGPLEITRVAGCLVALIFEELASFSMCPLLKPGLSPWFFSHHLCPSKTPVHLFLKKTFSCSMIAPISAFVCRYSARGREKNSWRENLSKSAFLKQTLHFLASSH